MVYDKGTVARVVHDFAALEARVSELEKTVRQQGADELLKAAFEPTPKAKYYSFTAPPGGFASVTATTTLPLYTTGITEANLAAPAPKVAPPRDVRETVTRRTLSDGLYTVTWEHELSGVKVSSVPALSEQLARQSAARLYTAAQAEHEAQFTSEHWFTVADFLRLRKATNGSHELCMRALHSSKDYSRALGYLLVRGVKLT